MVQELAGGQSLDEAQSEGGCQHETPINTLSPVHMSSALVIDCRALVIILPTHSFWLKSASEKAVIRPVTVVRQVSLTIVS